MTVQTYRPPPTIGRFMDDHESFVRGLMGPIGSGKSVGCTIDLFVLSQHMPPDEDGWRRSRNVIVRNTFRELEDTTMRTVFEWLPKDDPAFGTWWSQSDLTWRCVDERAQFQTEWLFRALDRPDHVQKLLSLELTHAWVNEAREVALPIINMLRGRLGRYPAMRDYGWETSAEQAAALLQRMMDDDYVPRVGIDIPYWYGLLMDTNPPDDDHWWYRLFEETRPAGWSLYRQPSARRGHGENLANLHPLYYHQLVQGQTDQWCKVYVDGEYGYVQEGKPVYPEYVDSAHTLARAVDPVRGQPVYLGGDWGLTPAVVLLQKLQGSWVVMDEVVAERLGAVNMAEMVRSRLASKEWAGCPIGGAWGDPSGGEGSSQIDEGETVFQVLNDAGLPFDPSPDASNNEVRRREAVASCLSSLSMAGRPRLMVNPKCKVLRKGLNGAFRYRRLMVAGDERYSDKRDKNAYSHVCEALEYALVGEGEGYELHRGGQDAVDIRTAAVEARARNVRFRTKRRPRRLFPEEARM